jgi:beta-phosphoglucomutase family hydrolase
MMAISAAHLGLPSPIVACLFDLDGVLTDTASVHKTAWKHMFDEFLQARDGADYTPFSQQDYNSFVDGKPRADGTRDFLASRGITLPDGERGDPPTAQTVQGLSTRKNDLVHEHIESDGVDVFPSSVQYVKDVRAAGLRTAVVSASENTERVLDVVGIADLFDARIDGVVTRRRGLPGKPAPDTYLAGAEAVGVTAAQAAVFEDAVSGVEAGRAGNFGLVVGVDRVDHAAALREHGADVVVTDLAELRVTA